MSSRAGAYSKKFEEFEFFLMLNVAIDIFEIMEQLNKDLQSSKLSINESNGKVQVVKDFLSQSRVDRFPTIWNQVVKAAASLGVNEPKKPRRSPRAIQRTAQEYYQEIYYQIYDNVIASIETRFDSETMDLLNNFENFIIGNNDNVDKVVSFYNEPGQPNDLDETTLLLHRNFLLSVARKRKVTFKSLEDVVNFLKGEIATHSLFYELNKFIRILLTIPSNACSAERSFSALRRLKSYLQSSMSQMKLNNIAILHIYQEEAESLDIEALMDEFINVNSRRRCKFALSEKKE